MATDDSTEVDSVLEALETPASKRGRPPKPSAPARLPVDIKSTVDSLSKDLGINAQDAIRLILPTNQTKAALDKIRELEALGVKPSGAGSSSADMKDLAMSLMWGGIVKNAMKSMGGDDEDMGGGINLDKIIGLTLLMQQNNQNMLAMASLNRSPQNDGGNDKMQEALERMAEQNQNLINQFVQVLGVKKEQEVVGEALKNQGEQISKALTDAVTSLKVQVKQVEDKVDSKLKEVEGKDKSTAMEKLKEAHSMVKEFDDMVMQIAKEKGLTPAEQKNLEDVSQVLDINLKYGIAQRVFALLDGLGKPFAEKAGEAAADAMFKKVASSGGAVPTQ
jgi:regulator of sigma D